MTLGSQTSLPTPFTRFIGRVEDLARLAELVAAVPLVTLIGPGGVGKSRLAVEAARTIADRFVDGVWLVELMGAGDRDSVVSALGAALTVPEVQGQVRIDPLVQYLETRTALVILDNCEHLVGFLDDVVAALITGCPSIRLLATSRIRLNLTGEALWPVDGLDLPEMNDHRWWQSPHPEAVELFVDRAGTVEPRFEVSDANAGAVAAICRRLDGLPLAIELAAARIRAFSPADIDTRLSDSFGFLTSTATEKDERHSSLQQVVQWSYDLLNNDEQLVFAGLSVFSGGFDLEFGFPVAGGRLDRTSFEAIIESLVDRSLLTRITWSAPATRYRMLETVRVFAAQVLASGPQEQPTRERHAVECGRRADLAADKLWGPEEVEWLDILEADHDNYRAALAWSVQCGNAQLAQLIAGALSRFWDLRGHYSEGLRWTSTACAVSGVVSTPIRIRALNGVATLALLNGGVEAAMTAATEAIDLAVTIGDDAGRAYALQFLGLAHLYAGEPDSAESVLADSVDSAELASDLRLLGWSSLFRAAVDLDRDNLAGVAVHIDKARAALTQVGESEGLGWCLVGDAAAKWRSGRHAEAASLLMGAFEQFHLLRAGWGTSSVAVVAGNLWLELREWKRAVRLLGKSELLRSSIGAVHLPVFQAWIENACQVAREQLGDLAFDEVWTQAQDEPPTDLARYLEIEIETLMGLTGDLDTPRLPPPASYEAGLSRDADIWTLTFQGRQHHLKHLVGFTHLSILINRIGQEIAAIELVTATRSRGGHPEPELEFGSAAGSGPQLDAGAIQTYRMRLTELQEDLDEADAWSDSERASHARAEIDILAAELASGVGLAGRPRQSTSDYERARVTATKAIRSAIRHIGEVEPLLGNHFESAVSTGAFCRYQPDPSSTITWSVESAPGTPPTVHRPPRR